VKEGDRVAALISTSTWSVAIVLASVSLGAIFTSITSDLGAESSMKYTENERTCRASLLNLVRRDVSLVWNWWQRPYYLQIVMTLTRGHNAKF
jgi:acyl-CoA synthetase (AMP-forming)/AMP-acid ligase II